MTKEDHIKYWIQSSEKDGQRIVLLIKGKDFVFALYSAHLVLEKLCKAVWVKENKGNHPPRVHNLMWILQETNVSLNEEENSFLRTMNDFQLEGRYPDYTFKIYKICNKSFTEKLLKESSRFQKKLRDCLL